MQYDSHPEQAGEVRVVGETIGQTAVVEAREFLQDQARHQLRLRELLGAEIVPMRGDGPTGGRGRDLKNPARRFAGGHIS
jgi:hypothetical protein